MAVNKKMHPRNPYKTPPSFKDLALKNEEFKKHAKIEINGKVSIDFKNADALRALTRALLKEDWGLDVVLPPEYLVPTVPLRINYILWMEDLVAALKLSDCHSPIFGIDIGTGASCIYPLLAAKKNGWHMIGIEKDETCFHHAQQNILRNSMETLVKVHRNVGETLIDVSIMEGSFEKEPNAFHFTMCNPPFFSSEEEVEKTTKSRSAEFPRPLPSNARTGSPNEIVVEGGEVGFVCNMIDESLLVKDRVIIFSTMLGHKKSFTKVLKYLKDKNICQIASTEFCQGQVTRWGLAWSHVVSLTCDSLSTDRIGSKQKPKLPLRYVLPQDKSSSIPDLNSLAQKVKQQMDQLSMEYKCYIKDGKSVGYHVTARSNTWSNQRRKRREHLKKKSESLEEKLASTPTQAVGAGLKEENLKEPGGSTPAVSERADEPPLKRAKTSEAEPEPLIVMGVVVRDEEETERGLKNLSIELCWLKGTGGQETVYQIMQYMKNNI